MSNHDDSISFGYNPARTAWALLDTINKGLQPAMDRLLRCHNGPIPNVTSKVTATSCAQPHNGKISKDDNEDAAAQSAACGLRQGAAGQTEPDAGVKARSIKCSECGKISKNTTPTDPQILNDIEAKCRETEDENLAAIEEQIEGNMGALTVMQAQIEADVKELAVIKAQIKAHRWERALKAAQEKAFRGGTTATATATGHSAPAAATATTSILEREFQKTWLQIQLVGDKRPLITTLPNDATLREVGKLVAGQTLAIEELTFTQQFPWKQFSSSDFSRTLLDLGLTPFATLIAIKGTENAEPDGAPEPDPQPEPDPISAEAEKLKEQGNEFFKSGQYNEAIDLYTKAIGLVSDEPAYLTNRAAAYIAIKRFRPALADCGFAVTLQTRSTGKPPPPKMLLRLARCHLELAQTTAALSTLRDVLTAEPGCVRAMQMQMSALQLEAHVNNLEGLRRRQEWGKARDELKQCLGAIEAEESEIPVEWRLWHVEIELAHGNWDGANRAVNDALPLQPNSPDVLTLRGLVHFLVGQFQQALEDTVSALRYDPGHQPAQRLRMRVKQVKRLLNEGSQAFELGRLREALSRDTEALELVGENENEGKGYWLRALLLSHRALTLVNLFRYDDALIDAEASLSLKPHFRTLRTRAHIRMHNEEYYYAIADFRLALELAEFDGEDSHVRAIRDDLMLAEAALERSKTDYYKILGIPRDCNEVDIRSAYRRQSLKHHPDKGGNEDWFKLLNEAYGVLSDPEQRKRYDLSEVKDSTTI
ncbi:hypothetical protein BJV74DRAFT_889074 [Russula compacta]|nr:hypothetical protein BJV74DRAFT_889074 [Russula compacta]